MRPGRSVAYARRCMAATSHPLATSTALDILRRGGNAVDAGLAACAVLAACEPNQTGLGGDCFALYAPGGGDHVQAYNGSGRLPAATVVDELRAKGSTIAADEAASITVPGAVEAWCRLSEAFGRMALPDILAPAIALAEEGAPVHERVAFDIALNAAKLSRDPVLAGMFLPGGRPCGPGALYRNPALGRTLRAVAEGGAAAFYRGGIARALVRSLQAWGGSHADEDFARHSGEFVAPVSTTYRGHTVFQCPPNSQGIITLILLRLLERLPVDAEGPLGGWRYHALMEAARLGFGYRDAYLGDPDHDPPDLGRLLGDAFIAAESGRIAPGSRLPDGFATDWPDHRDTVYLTVVDEERNAFSLINSLFDSFGSGRADPETGICLHSRGRSFGLKEGHPNCAAPGKRPLHTIIPGLLAKDGRIVMTFGVMGGHYQPVGQAHLLSSLLDYGLGLQEAVDLPRCFPQEGRIWVESSLPVRVREHLQSRGHVLAERTEPIGGAQLIWIDRQSGLLAGASDPRKDGCALGF